jgi:hypothetical protein
LFPAKAIFDVCCIWFAEFFGGFHLHCIVFYPAFRNVALLFGSFDDVELFLSKSCVSGYRLIPACRWSFSAVVPLQGTASWGAVHPSLKAGVKHG